MSLVLQINRGSILLPFDVGYTLPPQLNPRGVYSKRQQTRDILKNSGWLTSGHLIDAHQKVNPYYFILALAYPLRP